MPSTSTITAFYTFQPNTRAKASQVNVNFDVFRGHIIPVSPNTTTAGATQTWDLGSTDYRWRSIYADKLSMAGLTTTADLTLSHVPGSGGLSLKNGATEIYRIPLPATTAATITADIGGFASRQFSYSTIMAANVTSNVPNSTITISTLGRPVEVVLVSAQTTSAGVTGHGLQVLAFPNAANLVAFDVNIQFVVDNTNTSGACVFRHNVQAFTFVTSGAQLVGGLPYPAIRGIFFLPAGVHTFALKVFNKDYSDITVDMTRAQIIAREL